MEVLAHGTWRRSTRMLPGWKVLDLGKLVLLSTYLYTYVYANLLRCCARFSIGFLETQLKTYTREHRILPGWCVRCAVKV